MWSGANSRNSSGMQSLASTLRMISSSHHLRAGASPPSSTKIPTGRPANMQYESNSSQRLLELFSGYGVYGINNVVESDGGEDLDLSFLSERRTSPTP